MMSMTCHNLEFGRTRLDLVACGCSSKASAERFSVRNYAKGVCRRVHRGYGARKLVCCRRDIARCRVFSTKTPESLINGVAAGPPPVLDVKKESISRISPANLFQVVADDLQTLNKNLQSIIGAENPVLMSAAEQIFGAGGKRMRPALVFLVSRATAEIVGLKELTTEHRRLAEIIEMIHTASLIHDDVLDESDMRRGKETVHQLYGTRVAVLAGDFMFAQSSWYLANLENLEVIKLISQVIKDFASGEIKQASGLFDCDVELEEYLIKSYYKTASLIAAGTKGAAIFSGVDGGVSEQMYQYGKNLGLSFQVVDDILDFTQSAEQLGKPAGSDLAKGILTAPVIFALEKEPKLRELIESEFCETGSLDEAIELVSALLRSSLLAFFLCSSLYKHTSHTHRDKLTHIYLSIKTTKMSSAFSATKIIQPLPLYSTTRSPHIPLFDPLKTNSSPSPSSFLGSTHKLRLNSLNKPNSAHSHRQSTAVVAVSDVVKEKKLKSATSLSNLLITKGEGLELYEDMILGRAFEDMCAQMYYRGKMFGFVHLYNGQEAVSTGFIKLLKREDSVVSTYRDHVHALSKGVPARAVMSELFGKTTGCCRGQGGSMHMFSKEHNVLGGFAFIGEGIPVATGAAFTSKYRKEVLKEADCDHVTLAFFGDGTCNNGQFFECLNMAALWKLPIVFVVENNLWAIGMSHLRSTSDPAIWKKGPAFGMPGVLVDGMDVLKVREVAKEAVSRARRGEGPTLVECETYRFRGHSLADPDELRDPAEKAHYATRDPITALKKYMVDNNLASEAELKAIEKKIDEVVEEAVEFADSSPHPSRSQLLENVFADPKGFGIGPDGKYRCEDPKFTEGTAHV